MIIKDLVKLANHLDRKGHSKEANYLDALIKKAGPTWDLRTDISNIQERSKRRLQTYGKRVQKHYR